MVGHRSAKANQKGAAARRGGGRHGKAKPPAPGATVDAAASLEERITALERERDELRAALEEERARRRKLEEVYAAARDRISRALDSLHTILNGKR